MTVKVSKASARTKQAAIGKKAAEVLAQFHNGDKYF
jgi:hypothetical protein